MSVHMVRVFVEPPKDDAETAINNWVANYSEWTADPVTHALSETTAGRLQNVQGGLWHRLGYHVCPHDEKTDGPCAWDTVVESGSVPSDVPTIEVSV